MTTSTSSTISSRLRLFWVAALLLSVTSRTEAFVQPVSVASSTSTCTTTPSSTSSTTCRRLPALGMFDWFNPKPKPAPEPEPEKKVETPTTDASTDASASTSTAKVDEPKVEEPKVEAPAPTPAPAASTTPTAYSAPSEEIHKGKVKWYNPRKGFGFLVSSDPDATKEVFVHQSAIQAPGFRLLLDGEEVEYKVTEDKNGRLKAEQVTGPNGGDVAVTQRRKDKKGE